MPSVHRLLVLLSVLGLAILTGCKRAPEPDIDLEAAKKEGTIAAYRHYIEFRNHRPGVVEAKQLLHALYDKGLETFRARGPVNDEARRFVESWVRWHEANPTGKVAVRFRRPSKESIAALASARPRVASAEGVNEQDVVEVDKQFTPQLLDAHEATLLSALDEGWLAVFDQQLVAFERGEPYAADEEESRVTSGPTLFVTYDVASTAKVFHMVRMGLRLLPGIRHHVHARFRIDEAAVALDVDAIPSESVTFETDALSAGFANDPTWGGLTDDDAYKGLAKYDFSRVERALRARFVAVPPEASLPPRVTRLADDCEKESDWQACVELAQRYSTGDEVEVDQAKAAKLLEQPCLLGWAEACIPLAWMNIKGEGVARNWARASVLIESGCHFEKLKTIEQYAANKAYGGLTEEERKKGRPIHAECYELHADMSVHAPSVAAWAPADDVPRIDEFAEDDYLRACVLGRGSGCAKLAGLTKDPKRKVELRKQACDLGDVASCGKSKKP